MLDAAQLHHVVDVVEDVLDGRALAGANKIPDHGHADDAAFGRSRRMASSVLQRRLPGTRTRQLEWVMRTGLLEASMASSVVRSPQWETSTAMPSRFMRSTNLRSELAQARIDGIGRSAAEPVMYVGKLRNALAQAIEVVDILDGAKMLRILLADQDSDLARCAWRARNRRGNRHAKNGPGGRR